MSKFVSLLILVAIVLLLGVRNLPWHLDNYDQAKQAFTSYEMVGEGHWGFQHTPTGNVATKPPLAGWISAALYLAMQGIRTDLAWDLAWRIPPFLCALLILGILWKSGQQLGGRIGAVLATAAFGLNLMAPHLATLVRTDMMLGCFIFIAGWLIFCKVRSDQPWTLVERLAVFGSVLGSMLVKGPIAYAFLLPGLAAYAWIARRRQWTNRAWSGWMEWIVPLVIFALWVALGIWQSPAFYEQVVEREFLGRFTVGEAAVHTNQPVWFYLVHLTHKWLPWSIGLVALCCTQRARRAVRDEPALAWLVCWAIGGFILMSLVPSKRPDRIFPVIPPLCLLLAALWDRTKAEHSARFPRIAIGVALLFAGGYVALQIGQDYRARRGDLATFGREARRLTQASSERFAVVNGKDEGMLIYAGQTHFVSPGDAVKRWQKGELDWLLLGGKEFEKRAAELTSFQTRLQIEKISGKADSYRLLSRIPAETEKTVPIP